MERFLSAIRAQAGALDRTVGQPRFATVTSFNTADFTARVLLQPEGVVTGWLPVLSCWTGAGWGMTCPLAAGDQVFVVPQEGDAEHGVIVGRAFSKLAPPPATPVGELWINHQSGSCLHLRADGSVLISGDLHVTGQIFDLHGSLNQLRSIYNDHIHSITAGNQTTSPNTTD